MDIMNNKNLYEASTALKNAEALLQQRQENFNAEYAAAYYAGAELEPVSDRHLREIIPPRQYMSPYGRLQ